jgi:putative transposase
MNEKTVAKYMREMGIMAIYPGPNLSKRAYQAGIYPYLRNYSGSRVEKVWTELVD